MKPYEAVTPENVADLLGEAQSELRGWENLLEYPQFRKLIGVLQQQADELQMLLGRPLPGMDAVLAQEFNKGRLNGLLALTSAVEALMEDLKLDIERYVEIKNATGE